MEGMTLLHKKSGNEWCMFNTDFFEEKTSINYNCNYDMTVNCNYSHNVLSNLTIYY